MPSPENLERLERLAKDIGAFHSKLILLVGAPHSGKTDLLAAFAQRVDAQVLKVGSELGRRLAAIPHKQRHLEAGTELRSLADAHAKDDLLLMDNIELLFDITLRLNPLDLLKRHANNRRVVAVWPGVLRDGRLAYAEMGHPEYRDYPIDGLVGMELN